MLVCSIQTIFATHISSYTILYYTIQSGLLKASQHNCRKKPSLFKLSSLVDYYALKVGCHLVPCKMYCGWRLRVRSRVPSSTLTYLTLLKSLHTSSFSTSKMQSRTGIVFGIRFRWLLLLVLQVPSRVSSPAKKKFKGPLVLSCDKLEKKMGAPLSHSSPSFTNFIYMCVTIIW